MYKMNLSLFAYDPKKDKGTNYAAQMQAILNKGEQNLTASDYKNLANLEKAANEKVAYLDQTGTNKWGASQSSKYQDAYASILGRNNKDPDTGSGAGVANIVRNAQSVLSTPASQGSSYVPIDTSGIDWDKKNMSSRDYDMLQSYGKAWTAANQAGNKELADRYHQLAEDLRAKYLYSGGGDGSQYIPFEAPPVQQMSYEDILSALQASVGPAPAFDSRWDDTKNALAQAALDMNYEDFLNSEQYKALENRYGLQGRRAMQDVLGQVASRTGGLASSYSAQVANQQYNDYMSRLSEAAYDMYADESAMALQKARAAYEYDDADYDMYLDDLAQWNRNYGYAQDALARALEQSNYNDEWNYKVAQADKSDAMDRIDAFLAAGGLLSALSPALIEASGYTEPELLQLQNYYQEKLNPISSGGSGGGSGRRSSGSGKDAESPSTWDELSAAVGNPLAGSLRRENGNLGGSDEEVIADAYSVYSGAAKKLSSSGVDDALTYLSSRAGSNALFQEYAKALGITNDQINVWLRRKGY